MLIIEKMSSKKKNKARMRRVGFQKLKSLSDPRSPSGQGSKPCALTKPRGHDPLTLGHTFFRYLRGPSFLFGYTLVFLQCFARNAFVS